MAEPFDLDTARALATEARWWSDLGNVKTTLLLTLDALTEARATVARLNRRAQRAEATPALPAKTRKRAQRNRHDEAMARGMLAGMSLPTLPEFAAVAVAAVRNSLSTWNGLSAEEKTAFEARMLAGINYLATTHGIAPGDIYAASPGDPPPTTPGP